MGELRLYNVSDEYINYLLAFDRKVLNNKEENRKKERKYLGAVLKVNDMDYFVPLSSPKDTDYEIKEDGTKVIRGNVIAIIRMVVKDVNGQDELKGTLKFSNMIPVPKEALIEYSVEDEEDKNYQMLVLKEIDFIQDNKDIIYNNANKIHKNKIENINKPYIKATVDFLLLEEKCKEYGASKHIQQETENEVAVGVSKK